MTHDVGLRAGWRKVDDYVHSLIGTTVADVISQVRSAVPCNCADCMFELSDSLRIQAAIVQYNSTVRENTCITVEPGLAKDGTYAFFVRVRTGGCITHQESYSRENQARGRFEKVVEKHVAGEALNT